MWHTGKLCALTLFKFCLPLSVIVIAMFNVVNMIIIHFVHFTWDPFVEEKMFHPSIIQRGRTDNANNQIMRSLTLFKLFPPTAKDLIIIIARTPSCYTIWYKGVAYEREKIKRWKMKNLATLLKKGVAEPWRTRSSITINPTNCVKHNGSNIKPLKIDSNF